MTLHYTVKKIVPSIEFIPGWVQITYEENAKLGNKYFRSTSVFNECIV